MTVYVMLMCDWSSDVCCSDRIYVLYHSSVGWPAAHCTFMYYIMRQWDGQQHTAHLCIISCVSGMASSTLHIYVLYHASVGWPAAHCTFMYYMMRQWDGPQHTANLSFISSVRDDR